MLCSLCQGAVQKILELVEGKIAHHSSPAGLARSVEEGCMICYNLQNNLAKEAIDWGRPIPNPFTFWRLLSQDGGDLRVLYMFHSARYFSDLSEEPEEIWDPLLYYSLKAVPMLATTVGLSRERNSSLATAYSDNTGSSRTISQIKDWLEICTKTHVSCNQRRDNTWIPPRLLELCGSDNNPRIRLRNRSEVTSDRYLTLSHCWGAIGSQKLRLTAESFESFRQGIAVSDLQQTFQDTADIAARLGFQYFWVDCMCIFQDNAEDWRHQSSVMGKIYANTHLNISATWAADSTQGCFSYRDLSRELQYIDSPVRGTMGSTTWLLAPWDFWGDEVERAPVNLRGWVLQERVLSPRVVHFSKTQVYWECRDFRACEAFPDEALINEGYRDDAIVKRLPSDTTSSDDEKPENYWFHLTQKYGTCDLTFSTDRLIALSGVAHEVHKWRPSTYLAGLWSRDLLSSLTWLFPIPHNRPESYTAPSWSWASVESHGSGMEYTFPTSEAVYQMDILDAATTLKNPQDPFGEVTDGFIRARVHLAVTHFSRRLDYGFDQLLAEVPNDTVEPFVAARSASKRRPGFLYFDTSDDCHLQETFFVPVYTDIYQGPPGAQPERKQEMHGLLLLRLESSKYRRVGYASVFICDNDYPLHNIRKREITII